MKFLKFKVEKKHYALNGIILTLTILKMDVIRWAILRLKESCDFNINQTNQYFMQKIKKLLPNCEIKFVEK